MLRPGSRPVILSPIQAEIDRLAATPFDGRHDDELLKAAAMANALLCGLSAGPGLDGLGLL
jgi:hypothetical protein